MTINQPKHLLTIILLLLLVPRVHAANADEGNPEMSQLKDSVWKYFDAGPEEKFTEWIETYKKRALELHDLHEFYIGWMNDIIFQLNASNTFMAYKKAMAMSRDMRERNCDEDEYYMVSNMLGLIYSDCGNREMARKHFKEATQRIEDSKYSKYKASLYLDLAYVNLDKHPEEAEDNLSKALDAAGTDGDKSDAYAFRAVVDFKQKKLADFEKSYKFYKTLEKDGNSSIYGRYLDVYYAAYKRNLKEAIRLTDELQSTTDRYAVKKEVYEFLGDTINAYKVGEQLRHVTDSINSFLLTDNLKGISNELEVAYASRIAARNRQIAMIVVIVSSLIVIVALIYILISRRKHLRELRKKNRELTLARDQAMESDRMKTAFLQSVSHELRTPLNVITGFAQVMVADFDIGKDEQRAMANAMMQNTNQITGLVDEMLELSEHDSRTVLPKDETVALNSFCHDCIANLRRAVPAGVEIRLDSQLDDNFAITTNSYALKRILAALLDNAIKYTSQGSITVRPTETSIIVEDTGCGVPEEARNRIFERFVKIDDFKEGLGLGLPLCRSMAQRLGGDVTIDPAYTNGARFIVHL